MIYSYLYVFLIMKNTILCFILLIGFCANKLEAQNGYPTSINVTGYSTTKGEVTWDWSVGEPLMLSMINSNQSIFIYTGYLQNDFSVGIDLTIFERASPFKIGPNPVIQNLKINCNQNGMVITKIEVCNEQGQIYQSIPGPFSAIGFEQAITFNSANTGIYFIMIHYVVDYSFSKMNVFKIIKQ